MQVSTCWAQSSFYSGLWIDERSWITGIWVEPVRNVSSGTEHYWITQWTLSIFSNKFGQIEDLIEHRHPAVISSIVNGHFSWQIISPKFIKGWHVLVEFVSLFHF